MTISNLSEVSPTAKCLMLQTKWLVRHILSYIDISVESNASVEDKYPKKEQLKKLFEAEIYYCRDILVALNSPANVLGRLNDVYALLTTELQRLIVIALKDPEQRTQFMELVQEKVNAMKVQIKKELNG